MTQQLYAVAVVIHATAYVNASSLKQAREKGLKLEGEEVQLEDSGYDNVFGGTLTAGLSEYDRPQLSPAATVGKIGSASLA